MPESPWLAVDHQAVTALDTRNVIQVATEIALVRHHLKPAVERVDGRS